MELILIPEREFSKNTLKIDFRLTDFNGISTNPWLFYALRLGNRVYCTFILTFFVLFFLKVFC